MSERLLIDCSAVMAVLRDESPRSAILAASEDRSLVAAVSLPSEVLNALSSLLKQRKVTLDQAIEVAHRFSLMEIALLPVRSAETLRLAAKHQAYAYDCGVVELAVRERLELLTLDRGMMHVAKAERVALVRIHS